MSAADDVLQKLREKASSQGMSESEIAQAVAEALKNVADDIKPNSLYHELEALAIYIKNARKELSALQAAQDMSTEYIPSATDELDAVTEATANATNEIMNQCDEIGAIGGQIGGEVGDKLQNSIGRIYEACNFQDITGQRITKVVKTLKYIEQHIDDLVRLFGSLEEAERDEPVGEAALLNGPQLPANASSQEDIDKLLASFDAPSS